MFAPSLMTLTGSVVNRIEDWSTSQMVGGRLFLATMIGTVGLLSFGVVECLVSGIQFLLYVAPVVVKQTLRLMRLQTLADRLPECGFGTLKTLAHKTLALAIQVIVGGGLLFVNPQKVVGLYDSLGLERHRVSVVVKKMDLWRQQISAVAQRVIVQLGPLIERGRLFVIRHQIPMMWATVVVTILGARLAVSYAQQPPTPAPASKVDVPADPPPQTQCYSEPPPFVPAAPPSRPPTLESAKIVLSDVYDFATAGEPVSLSHPLVIPFICMGILAGMLHGVLQELAKLVAIKRLRRRS